MSPGGAVISLYLHESGALRVFLTESWTQDWRQSSRLTCAATQDAVLPMPCGNGGQQALSVLHISGCCVVGARTKTGSRCLTAQPFMGFSRKLLCRCPACPGSTQSEVLANWTAEMSEFMKCIDPNHMVSIGLEGYFGETDTDE